MQSRSIICHSLLIMNHIMYEKHAYVWTSFWTFSVSWYEHVQFDKDLQSLWKKVLVWKHFGAWLYTLKQFVINLRVNHFASMWCNYRTNQLQSPDRHLCIGPIQLMHKRSTNHAHLPEKKAWERGYEKLSADFVPTELTYMYYWVIRHHYTTGLQCSIYWFDTTALGSMEFISISCALHLRLCFGF